HCGALPFEANGGRASGKPRRDVVDPKICLLSRSVPDELGPASIQDAAHSGIVPAGHHRARVLDEGREGPLDLLETAVEVQVVLPWAPATATERQPRISAASTWALVTTGIPAVTACRISTLSGGIAEEITTASGWPTCSTRWPANTSAPSSPSDRRFPESLRSE